MSRILLTGGTGMVGRNLLEHKAASRHDVIAPRRSELDLTVKDAVERFVKSVKPDLIIHAAGRVGGIQANMSDQVGFLVENLDMGRNIVMAGRNQGTKRLLNLGSSCIYPLNAPIPLAEEYILTGPLENTNEGYALAKLVTARLCDHISTAQSGFSYKTLMPCNLYGRHDKFDPAVSHLLPAVIRKIHDAKIAGSDRVEIWGDGTARREFMFAGDLADAIWSGVDGFDRLPSMMNVGVGTDHTIDAYYHVVAEVVGWQGKFFHDPAKPTGVKRKLVSVERQKAFGWMPGTSLVDGIRQTYDYFLSVQA